MTTLSSKRCIFCGRSGSEVKITKEHVWPYWLRTHLKTQLLPGPLELRKNETVIRTRPDVLFSVSPCIACIACNTGWMKQLEERARPLLLPMLDGLNLELSPADQSIVAAWCAKTCFAVLHAQEPLPKIVPEKHHRRLWESKGFDISDDLDVLIAMDDTNYFSSETGKVLITSFSPRQFTIPHESNAPVYVLSLRIHRFVTSVVGPETGGNGWSGTRQDPYPGQESHVLRLAPSSGSVYQYPPISLREAGGFAKWSGWTRNPALNDDASSAKAAVDQDRTSFEPQKRPSSHVKIPVPWSYSTKLNPTELSQF
jgi:hypothetical protein